MKHGVEQGPAGELDDTSLFERFEGNDHVPRIVPSVQLGTKFISVLARGTCKLLMEPRPSQSTSGGSPLDGRDGSVSDEMVVRMSLGMGSDFEDIWNVLRWAKSFLEEEILEHELVNWRSASASRPRLLSA